MSEYAVFFICIQLKVFSGFHCDSLFYPKAIQKYVLKLTKHKISSFLCFQLMIKEQSLCFLFLANYHVSHFLDPNQFSLCPIQLLLRALSYIFLLCQETEEIYFSCSIFAIRIKSKMFARCCMVLPQLSFPAQPPPSGLRCTL